jgi:hypothetical protein
MDLRQVLRQVVEWIAAYVTASDSLEDLQYLHVEHECI